MAAIKQATAEFLSHKRVAVTGVSRTPATHGSNAVYKRLRERGYEVFAVNPNAHEVEGDPAFPDLRSIPGSVEADVCPAGGSTAKARAACVHRDIGERRFDRAGLHTWRPESHDATLRRSLKTLGKVDGEPRSDLEDDVLDGLRGSEVVDRAGRFRVEQHVAHQFTEGPVLRWAAHFQAVEVRVVTPSAALKLLAEAQPCLLLDLAVK